MKTQDYVCIGRTIVSYPYNKEKVECLVTKYLDGVFTLLPCRSQDKISNQCGMPREISKSTLNRLAKFLYQTRLYEYQTNP